MDNREKLVEELNNIKTKCGDKGSFYPACMGCVADFILADRRRIVEHLVKLNVSRNNPIWGKGGINNEDLCHAIEETIKNSGA